jgi:hypothetical protein
MAEPQGQVPTVTVDADDLADVLDEASSHLAYWGAESPEFERVRRAYYAAVRHEQDILIPTRCGVCYQPWPCEWAPTDAEGSKPSDCPVADASDPAP